MDRGGENQMRIFKKLMIILFIAAGVALMVYPYAANYLFENRKDSVISTYKEEVERTDTDAKDQLEKASDYNASLATGNIKLHDPFTEMSDQAEEDYYTQLRVDGTEVMGLVEIPKIGVSLPIYHGTSEEVLQMGVGHLEGTSLPVGGESTHCVLTGHTGLSDARMFTDLTEMEEGDIFFLEVMGETFAYQVYRTSIIEPTDLSSLYIETGRDLCTLVTCTPYGVNSHRLLVQAERTEYTPEVREEVLSQKPADGEWERQYRQSLIAAGGLILLACIVLVIKRRRAK